jgi:hypothetical protein
MINVNLKIYILLMFSTAATLFAAARSREQQQSAKSRR